jgi:hypothetical protein
MSRYCFCKIFCQIKKDFAISVDSGGDGGAIDTGPIANSQKKIVKISWIGSWVNGID